MRKSHILTLLLNKRSALYKGYSKSQVYPPSNTQGAPSLPRTTPSCFMGQTRSKAPQCSDSIEEQMSLVRGAEHS